MNNRKLPGGGGRTGTDGLQTRLFGHLVVTGMNIVFLHSFGFHRRLFHIKKDAPCALSLQHLPSPYSMAAPPVQGAALWETKAHGLSPVRCLFFSSTFPFSSEYFHHSTSTARISIRTTVSELISFTKYVYW